MSFILFEFEYPHWLVRSPTPEPQRGHRGGDSSPGQRGTFAISILKMTMSRNYHPSNPNQAFPDPGRAQFDVDYSTDETQL